MLPMTPELVLLAIRGAVQIGGAVKGAYEQRVRNEPVTMPDLEGAAVDPIRVVYDWFVDNEPAFVNSTLWIGHEARDDKARAKIMAAYFERRSAAPGGPAAGTSWIGARLDEAPAAALLLRQWPQDQGPASPGWRIALSFADVALQVAGANPSVIGAGGGGEKLVAALVQNLRDLLPDVDNPQHWTDGEWNAFLFAESAATILFRAGLKTVVDNPETVVAKKQYQALLKSTLRPLLALYEDHPHKRPSLAKLRDTVLGPMAQAALKTLGEQSEKFFGDGFRESQAAGALTKAIFTDLAGEIAESGSLVKLVGEDGLILVYRSALATLATKPGAFIGNDQAQLDAAARDLLASIAGALRDAPAPFWKAGNADGTIGARAAAAALESIGRMAPTVLGTSNPWDALAGRLIVGVTSGLKDGIGAGHSVEELLEGLFSKDQVLSFTQIFFDQAAKTPGLILGEQETDELRALVAAVATSMKQEGAKLLTPEGWLVVAKAAAEEAAKNPARLLRLDVSDPNQQLLAGALTRLLGAAQRDMDAKGRTQGSVLFGETLEEALKITIEAAAGNARRAIGHFDQLVAFVDNLNALATANDTRIGAKEWLWLYRTHLSTLLDDGDLAKVAADKLIAALYTSNQQRPEADGT